MSVKSSLTILQRLQLHCCLDWSSHCQHKGSPHLLRCCCPLHSMVTFRCKCQDGRWSASTYSVTTHRKYTKEIQAPPDKVLLLWISKRTYAIVLCCVATKLPSDPNKGSAVHLCQLAMLCWKVRCWLHYHNIELWSKFKRSSYTSCTL